MEVKKYRARSMQQALALVRRELGPQASVLRTRAVRGGLLGWMSGAHEIEVLASASISVPSRLPTASRIGLQPHDLASLVPPASSLSSVSLDEWEQRLASGGRAPLAAEIGPVFLQLFADLLDADVPAELAREWVERLRREANPSEPHDLPALKRRLAAWIEQELTRRDQKVCRAPDAGAC